jgi:hypothetical protein
MKKDDARINTLSTISGLSYTTVCYAHCPKYPKTHDEPLHVSTLQNKRKCIGEMKN